MDQPWLNDSKSAKEAIGRAYSLSQGDSVFVDVEKQHEAYLPKMADLYVHPDPSVDSETRDESRFLFRCLNMRAAALEPLAMRKRQDESPNSAG